MNVTIKMPNGPLLGHIRPESDKSISQRVILFSLLTEQECVIKDLSQALDPLTAFEVAKSLGLHFRFKGTTLITKGPGINNLHEPTTPLNCGNSGTLMRFLMGLLAPSKIFAVLTGDESLNNRPMERIAQPLRSMGAQIFSRDGGLAPLVVKGGKTKGISYSLPVASAQLKSALILAGLNSEGTTTINEPVPSRDHTERILEAMGADIKRDNNKITVKRTPILNGIELKVGGDFSAAAFYIGAGLLVRDSEIILEEVNLNPTRTGLLNVLERMGMEYDKFQVDDIEPIGSLVIKSQSLKGTVVTKEEIPLLIDEIPLLAVVAAASENQTVIQGVSELRVKESDRLKGILDLLSILGRKAYTSGEGEDLSLVIEGELGPFPVVDSKAIYNPHKDHRLAMAASIAALNCKVPLTIIDADCSKVSQPYFYGNLLSLGAVIG